MRILQIRWIQKKRIVIIVLCLLLGMAGAGVAYKAGMVAFGDNTPHLSIPQSVTINGKTYTAQNRFTILEIVPQEGLGEWGYMVGGDSMPVSREDFKLLSVTMSDNEKNNWYNCVGVFTNKWGSLYYPNYTQSIEGYDDRNLFANAVFKCSDMSDKIKVESVGAQSVTKEMVDQADMVYVNTGYHSELFSKTYNMMADASRSVRGLSKNYKAVRPDNNRALFKDYSFSAEVALEIYIRSVKNGMPLVFDNSQTNLQGNNPLEGDNYSKLGNLILDIDPDIFVMEYAQEQLQDGTYTGTKGTIGVYREGGQKVLHVRRNNANLKWEGIMFSESDTAQFPHPNGGADGRNLSFLRKNIFSFDGDRSLSFDFLTGGNNIADRDSNGRYRGTDFDIAKNRYGTMPDGRLAFSDMIRYIIGDIPRQTEFYITALEIQPSAAYRYNTYEGAVRIASYFGYDTRNMHQDNWTSYVSVRSVASNGFNGMNEDLKENYDLIIVGANNPDMYLKNPQVYASYGETIKINKINKDARMSGNDLTKKSLDKLIEYAKAGKPMVIAQELYYETDKVMDDSIISSLSYRNLKPQIVESPLRNSNIACEPASGEFPQAGLTFLKKPTVRVSDQLKVVYQGDIVTTTIPADSLNNFRFSMNIDAGEGGGTYQVLLYIDKNGNGIFTEESSDDTNELAYNRIITTDSDGGCDLKLELPDTLRGYIAWKVIVVNKSTGLSSEERGGFVVEVKSEDIKTVKLLQILPVPTAQYPITLNMKQNSRFQSLFANIEQVTGLKLDITTMTTREFESSYTGGNQYTKGNYNANNMLSPYSMVVLGFSDAFSYDDISNENGALDNLYDYLEKGNSVLFVHDLTSFITYSDGQGTVNYGDQLIQNSKWSFNLTKEFRYRIGMDRYGVSALNIDQEYRQGYTNEFLMRFGSLSGRTYSPFIGGTPTNQSIETNRVDQLNTGQVTEFPYKVPQNLEVAKTHAQYFQLDLEEQSNANDDVVVWYTLGQSSNGNNYYGYTGQDALNAYYIYSKGNVTYTGAGHSVINGDAELKLFVNTIIRAIMSGNSTPVVKVENAVMQSDGRYELFTRDHTQIPNVEFTATDKDLSKNTGIFKSGMVYWDVDGDGVYTDKDILLISYDTVKPLRNAQKVTVDLNQFADKRSENQTLQECYQRNQLKIGITAVDNLDAQGSASVNILYRNLFQLN